MAVEAAWPQPHRPLPATDPAGGGPLDPAGVQRLQEEFGSSSMLESLVGLFGRQTPELVDGLRVAVANGDPRTVRAVAHKLKGGCATMAATRMADLCGRLESEAVRGSLAGAPELVDQIAAAAGETQEALLREVARAT